MPCLEHVISCLPPPLLPPCQYIFRSIEVPTLSEGHLYAVQLTVGAYTELTVEVNAGARAVCGRACSMPATRQTMG
jgi:hypothetical protein